MSLTDFVKRPRIRKAFGEFATSMRTPAEFKKARVLVKDVKGPRGLAGTSFDYLARFHIARVLRDANVEVVERQWISEFIQDRLTPNDAGDGQVYDVGENERWQHDLSEAHRLAYEYIGGRGSMHWLALMVQYMAHTDLLTRSMFGFDMNFDARGRVARELIDILNFFDPVKIFEPKKTIFLNPQFALHEIIGGADGDLIIDDTLIELKTVTKLSVSKSYLLQLAGYVALNELGGIETDHGEAATQHINNVGIYFARHNKFVKIPLMELFPDNGFDKFMIVFKSEFEEMKVKHKKRQREFESLLAKYGKRNEIIRPPEPIIW